VRISWHGHACFEVQDKVTVITDPHDGKSLGIKAPSARADVVLVSHDHFDHNCTRLIKGDYTIVKEPGKREVKGVKIIGVEASHDEAGGAKRGRIVIYKFEMGGVRFCHCGDLGEELRRPQLDALEPIDVLFVPVGSVFTIDGKQARRLVSEIKPKIAIPMHYRYGGLSLSIQTVDPFLEGLPKDKVQRMGNAAEFTIEDLPEETEYWVFSS